MKGSGAEETRLMMGKTVTSITQRWEQVYPIYPYFGDFYNPSGLLYPICGKTKSAV
jgi:hypothetical protein